MAAARPDPAAFRRPSRRDRHHGVDRPVGQQIPGQGRLGPRKAAGLHRPVAEDAPAFLAPRPVSFIWGIGKAGAERYAKDGMRTIADLQRAGESELMRRYGGEGLRLARLAFGRDSRKVDPEGERKTVSAETTFDHDLAGRDDLLPILLALCPRGSRRG